MQSLIKHECTQELTGVYTVFLRNELKQTIVISTFKINLPFLLHIVSVGKYLAT